MTRKKNFSIVVLWFLFSVAIAHADAVLDWNNNMVTTVSGQNPFAQARYAAITQLAKHRTLSRCTRPRARSILLQKSQNNPIFLLRFA
ncbi:MAG: hypothetical protein ACM3PW_08455 [Chlamydiota bacterium]|jgi:hypothetical protein